MSCATVSFTGGGLKFWIEAYSTTTQDTVSFTPKVSATNVCAAIVPKGTGAIVAQIPDGTFVGGNARGVNAIDFQRIRFSFSGASRVASGTRSFIGNGENNAVSGSNSGVLCGESNSISGNNCGIVAGTSNSIAGADCRSFIGGGNGNSITGFPLGVGIVSGQSNTANSSYAFIGGGQSNTASNTHSVVCGGQNNTASGNGSAVLGGLLNLASGYASSALGGERNTASGSYSSTIGGFYSVSNLHGQTSHASGRFSADGDAQAHELIWRREITGTATTELFLDGASVAAILPSTNSVWHGIIDVVAICTVAGAGTTVVGHVEATSYKVTIKRIGTTTSLVGGVQEIGITNADASMSTAAFIITNNDTNESLQIAFTPPTTAAANTVIRAVATFRGTQIKY